MKEDSTSASICIALFVANPAGSRSPASREGRATRIIPPMLRTIATDVYVPAYDRQNQMEVGM